MDVAGYISKKLKVFFVGLGFVLSIVIGFIDYIISPEISFSIFYLIPVLMITWFVGRCFGVSMAVFCSLLWLLAELKHGLVYPDRLIPYWNAVVRLGFFLIVTFLADNVKRQKVSLEEKVKEKTSSLVAEIDERKKAEADKENLIVELQVALAEVKKLSGFLPICASCKKIRDDEGYWKQIETYITEHSEAQFSHGICPDCAKKLYPEYYEKVKAGGNT